MMRSLCVPIAAAVFFLGCSGAYASGSEKHPAAVVHVTAQGEAVAGEPDARDLAVANALRNAVMTGVGAYVDSTMIGENFTMIRDELLVKASGFATLDSIESTSVRDGIVRVTIKASVSNRPLADKLKELGLTHEWKIGVFMPEKYISKPQPIPDPAAEMSIIQHLLKAGFRVMDETQRKQLQDDDAAIRAAKGDVAAIKLLKREYDVDIFVTGEAFAQYVDEQEEGGVRSYRTRGRIEARAFYTDTGELLSATDAFADGVDDTEDLAAKQCLKSAGQKVGSVLSEDLLIAPASHLPFVTLKIGNLKSVSSAADFGSALKQISGISKVKAHRYTAGTQEWDLYVKAEYMDLLPAKIEGCKTGKRLGVHLDICSRTYIQGRAR